jgi:UDP-N-acetyl-D-mannosaminuronic acid dehydrogenase
VEVVHLLTKAGAVVKAFEPFKSEAGLPGVDAAPTLELALKEAEAVLLLVEHTEFRQLTPEALKALTRARVLIDTVNGWSGQAWMDAGFKLFRLGVGK